MSYKFDEKSVDRFLNRLQCMKGCWGWIGSVHPDGYGRVWMKVDGKFQKWNAHRVSWLLFRGGIPTGQQVLHRCDNPICTNPDHLFLGDQNTNIQDMIQKGRQRLYGAARLSKFDIKAIRWLVSQGTQQKDLAFAYDIHPQHIFRIVHRTRWANV